MNDQAIRPASRDDEDHGDTAGLGVAQPLRSILDSAHDVFIAIDGRGRVIEWNREAERTFGFSREEALGRELAETIVPPRYREAHRAGLIRYQATGTGSLLDVRAELSAVHREGREFPIEMTISETRIRPANGDGDGDVRVFHAFLHDISERKLSERVLVAMQSVTEAMARSQSPEQAMGSLLATLGQRMGWKVGAFWRLAHDGALERTASWSAGDIEADEFEQLSGELRLSTETSLPGRALIQRASVWVEDYAADASFPRADAARRAGLHAAISVPVMRNSDIVGVIEFFASELRVRDHSISGALAVAGVQVGELLGVLEERQALVASLAQLALTDQLTGLPNRRAWEDGLERELARADRDGNAVCVAVIDLDDFKRFNDEHGHLAGDALLAGSARAWQKQLRASDLLARYGGEEFAALIPAWPLATAVTVVERLRQAVPTGLTASAGVACWNRAETARELFGRADGALYEAKQRGRNRTVAAE